MGKTDNDDTQTDHTQITAESSETIWDHLRNAKIRTLIWPQCLSQDDYNFEEPLAEKDGDRTSLVRSFAFLEIFLSRFFSSSGARKQRWIGSEAEAICSCWYFVDPWAHRLNYGYNNYYNWPAHRLRSLLPKYQRTQEYYQKLCEKDPAETSQN